MSAWLAEVTKMFLLCTRITGSVLTLLVAVPDTDYGGQVGFVVRVW
jgi:hypothetical protein